MSVKQEQKKKEKKIKKKYIKNCKVVIYNYVFCWL